MDMQTVTDFIQRAIEALVFVPLMFGSLVTCMVGGAGFILAGVLTDRKEEAKDLRIKIAMAIAVAYVIMSAYDVQDFAMAAVAIGIGKGLVLRVGFIGAKP